VGQRQGARLPPRHRQRRRRPVQCRPAWPALGSFRAPGSKLDADLKAHRRAPTKQREAALQTRFDRIFKPKTGFVTLDRLLVRLNANKPELLTVLDRPEIPLQTNGSENNIRRHPTRRKVSATLCQATRQSPPRRIRWIGVSDWTLPYNRVATYAIREVIERRDIE
jgi:hypothetical protein